MIPAQVAATQSGIRRWLLTVAASVTWPLVFGVLAFIVSLWPCATAAGCLARSSAAQVPLVIAAPGVGAAYGAGLDGAVMWSVGVVASLLLWLGLGMWTTRTGGGRERLGLRWWLRYVGVSAAWSVLVVVALGLAVLRELS